MFTTLVIGATGGIGGAVALELTRRRDPVRLLVRDLDKAAARFPDRRRAELVKGDVFDESTLLPATKDVDLIVFAVNFPFAQWEQDFPRATQAVINAARHSGAAILFPGNTYALGPASKTQYKEDSPNQPCCRVGVIRADVERMLREAAEKPASGGANKIQVLNVRSATAFGPTIRNPVVNRVFGSAVDKKPMKFVGKLTAPHQWTYAPDLARAMIDTATARSKMGAYEVINYPGYTVPKQEQFLRLVAERAGRATLPIDIASWTMMKMTGLVSKEAKSLLELQHLFDGGVLLEAGRFARLIAGFKSTPAELAIDETVVSYRKDREEPATDEEDDE